MSTSARYRIHPAIGIARVGNAPPGDYFLGPERPHQKTIAPPDVGTAVPPFKSDGLVKRQAARFRIWEYVEHAGVWSPAREVSLDDQDVAELTWTVHLANRKASFFKFNGLAGSPKHGIRNTERRNVGEPRALEIDPLPRSISGPSAGPSALSKGSSSTPADERWPDPAPSPDITSLGELRTDDAGRLIVVPGEGRASGWDTAEITQYANNPGWFDDVGDGPVTATLTLRGPDGTIAQHDVEGAWLLVGPPDFAPPVPQLVSLYDVLFDMAVQGHVPIPDDESIYRTGELARLSGLQNLLRGDASYQVDFDTDVAPILRAAFALSAVYEPVDAKPGNHGHARAHTMGGDGIDAGLWAELADPGRDSGIRLKMKRKVRKPGATLKDLDGKMPKLFGDDYQNRNGTGLLALTVTPTQYAILERWADNDFVGSELGPSSLLDPPEAEALTPHGLDRAAIECASGGGFFPGIEVGWLIREASLFVAPFRIRHGAPSPYLGGDDHDDEEAHTTVGAGFFSRQMALPWQADFLACRTEGEWGWWPSQRPDSVVPALSSEPGKRVPWHRASGPDGEQAKWRLGGDSPTWQEMIANWWRFGFVQGVDDGGEPNTHWRQFRETERIDPIAPRP